MFPRRRRVWGPPLVALCSVLVVSGCGGTSATGGSGAGIPTFIVTSFNTDLLGCRYGGVVRDLRRETTLFEPSAYSDLWGKYTLQNYIGPPDPRDSSVPSRDNPPPSRAQELADVLGLFTNGRFAGTFGGYQTPPPAWPFEESKLYIPAGTSFSKVCKAVVAHEAGSNRQALRASYRPFGTANGGAEVRYLLSFPSGSATDGSLRVSANRLLVVERSGGAWRIKQFAPYP